LQGFLPIKVPFKLAKSTKEALISVIDWWESITDHRLSKHFIIPRNKLRRFSAWRLLSW
jgi:hypothetical protein